MVGETFSFMRVRVEMRERETLPISQDPTFVRMDNISSLEFAGFSSDDPPTPREGCRDIQCGYRVCGKKLLTLTILQVALVAFIFLEFPVVMSKLLIDQSSTQLQQRTRGGESIRYLSSRVYLRSAGLDVPNMSTQQSMLSGRGGTEKL
jgi:hypothetical protein